MTLNAWKTAKKEAREAREFFALIGRPQRTTAQTVGRLHNVRTAVQIHHQERDGAKNYHENAAFSAALAAVVTRHFSQLAKEALADLDEKARVEGKKARDDVEKMLAEIDAA